MLPKGYRHVNGKLLPKGYMHVDGKWLVFHIIWPCGQKWSDVHHECSYEHSLGDVRTAWTWK